MMLLQLRNLKKRSKCAWLDQTFKPMVETPQLSTMLTTYYLEFEAYSREREKCNSNHTGCRLEESVGRFLCGKSHKQTRRR